MEAFIPMPLFMFCILDGFLHVFHLNPLKSFIPFSSHYFPLFEGYTAIFFGVLI